MKKRTKRSSTDGMRSSCTFRFFGLPWTLERSKKDPDNENPLGAKIDEVNQKIWIQASYPPEKFKDYLMHELMEGAGYHSGSCWDKQYPSREYLYIFTHDKLDTAASQVRAAYDEICSKILPRRR